MSDRFFIVQANLAIPIRFNFQKVVNDFRIRHVEVFEGFERDSGSVEHSFYGTVLGIVVGLYIQIYYAFHSGLRDGLRAVRARVERAVERGAFEIAPERVVNRVPFGMHYVGVFGIFSVHVVMVGPKLGISVVESDGETVIPDADDLTVGIYHAGTVLGLGIF